MPWHQTGATQYNAQLELPYKDHAIKLLNVCNNWNLKYLDLLNSLALGCYQLSPEVLIVLGLKQIISLKNVDLPLIDFLDISGHTALQFS